MGCNITVPFKEEVVNICDILTKRAKISGSVNTIKKLQNGKLLGDNTDGIGLIKDLKRLRFIKKNDVILLVGAGGAARGIILSLLSLNCSIFITNRNMDKARNIVDKFKIFGNIILITNNELHKIHFNLIINATSSGLQNTLPILPEKIICPTTYCYDMYYQLNLTPFLRWCKKIGSAGISDGIGMLVIQAAYSFFLWFGKLPDINSVIDVIKIKYKK